MAVKRCSEGADQQRRAARVQAGGGRSQPPNLSLPHPTRLAPGIPVLALRFDSTPEEGRHHRHERFESVLRGTKVGAWDLDLRRQTIHGSPRFYEMLGYAPDELALAREGWEDHLHPSDRERVCEQLRRHLAEHLPYNDVFRLRTKSGGYGWFNASGQARWDRAGRAVGMAGSLIEISGLQRIESELQKAHEEMEMRVRERTSELTVTNAALRSEIEERLRTREALLEKTVELERFFTASLDMLSIIDHDGYFRRLNPAWEKNLGYPLAELVDKKLLDFVHPDDAGSTADAIAHLAAGREVVDFVNRLRHREGGYLWIEWRAVANLGRLSYSAARDVSERVRLRTERAELQKRLVQAEKMEAIGTLAGGIAHDFNNILAIIIGYAEAAKLFVAADSLGFPYLDKILLAGLRAKELVRQILLFSSSNREDTMAFNPAAIVKEALKMIRSLLPATITLNYTLDQEVGTIYANPTKLQQIILNLCTNAQHAMEESGGELSISLKNIQLPLSDNPRPARRANDSRRPTGSRWVELVVGDSGSGIEPAIIDRIFEPYFTTKETGKGTGIGLSIVHGIVQGYGGTITVSSEPGVGTTFRVLFPACAPQPQAAEKEGAAVAAAKIRILLVDDEESLGEASRIMLEHLGYTVTYKKSGEEALALFQEQPELFDLVVTDQTMPAMSGVVLAQRLLALRPTLPIILCTGYTPTVSAQQAQALGIKEFAFKPLAMRDFSRLVEKALATPVGASA